MQGVFPGRLPVSVRVERCAIANGRNRILPAGAILEGEYGRTDIAMGVPCVLAEKRLARVIDFPEVPVSEDRITPKTA